MLQDGRALGCVDNVDHVALIAMRIDRIGRAQAGGRIDAQHADLLEAGAEIGVIAGDVVGMRRQLDGIDAQVTANRLQQAHRQPAQAAAVIRVGDADAQLGHPEVGALYICCGSSRPVR